MRTTTKPKKVDKREQAETEFAKLVENISVRGFHGTASVTVQVQDGHIQHTRVMVDRMVR